MFQTSLRAFSSILLLLFFLNVHAENPRFMTSHFAGSDVCADCHDGLTDIYGENVSIARDWGASMMANSTKDPLWRAKLATEMERNPHLTDTLSDVCTKCHAPMANFELTKVQGKGVSLFGPNGILDRGNDLHDAALNGVSCTLCHQIMDDPDLGSLPSFSGNYTINGTKTIYGQYSDVFGRPMQRFSGFTPAYSAHVSDSALCAVCHNLKTPFVDADGTVVTTSPDSEFPEQMPYTEWEQSIFADGASNPKSCQDCHMPKTTARISSRPGWVGTKSDFAKHHFAGANTTMLTLLRDNADELDVISPNMDLAIDRARAMLQSAATIEIVSATVENGMLEARLKVQNESGHKVPTSYPSRRLWIHFKVADSNGDIVFESGKINAEGAIAGADGDAKPTVYEPHYDVITAADQVQIYEPVVGDTDGNITYTLLRSAYYIKDNRLTPRGFDKTKVPDDVAVKGLALGDLNFNLGSDEITYRFKVEDAGELTITATLNYQTIEYPFLQDLYRNDHLEQVQTFKAMYDAQDLKHEQIASANTTVVSDGGGTTVTAPTLILSAVPSTIDQGQSTTLEWISTETINCTASWTSVTATSGTAVLVPDATTTYAMTCSGDGGSVTESVTVTVNTAGTTVPLPTTSLSATPTTIDQGQSVTLSWSSTEATSCVADWTTSVATSGSASVTPNATTTYTMTCSGDGGNTSDSVVVTVNALPVTAAPTVTLTSSPTWVVRGGAITLNWSSTDANTCTAAGGWSGAKALTGSESIVINGPATFTLTCDGTGGSTSQSVSYQAWGRRFLNLIW